MAWCGWYHTCCLDKQQKLWAFGNNGQGQLGVITAEASCEVPVQVLPNVEIISVSVGRYHTACVDTEGNLYTFGFNGNGQLGGVQKKQGIVQIKTNKVLSVHCGLNHTMFILENKTLFGVGANDYGQLGNNNLASTVNFPVQVVELTNVEFIECGGNHNICLASNKLYSFGANNYGQSGLGHKQTNITSPTKVILKDILIEDINTVSCGKNHSIILTANNEIYSFGYNSDGQLGLGDTVSRTTPEKILNFPNIHMVSCGYDHTMCVDFNGELWVFGANNYGQLGLGHNNSCLSPNCVPSIHSICSLSSGGYNTIVKDSSDGVWAFGYNSNGQLGIGNKENQQKPVPFIEEYSSILGVRHLRLKSARK